MSINGFGSMERSEAARSAVSSRRRGGRTARSAVGSAERLHCQLGNRAFRQAVAGERPLVQRCACGGTCAHCRAEEKQGAVQAKLTVGAPDDAYEREAEGVAERVTAMAEMARVSGAPVASRIQRLCGAGGSATSTDVALPAAGARPLSAETRAFMGPRFGADFSGVRVHAGPESAAAAERLSARAFTKGRDIWLGRGAAEGDRRLMAHELTHVVQQAGAPAGTRVQRTWEPSGTDCNGQPTTKWIERVVVQQESPQAVTVHWSDGSTESDPCSTGKGHCCVDPANPDGVACTIDGSHADGSNCTPITRANGYLVRNRVRDHHGVEWWTEFVPDRAIALHEYTPVDGTPLSHGCVRMNHDMAVKIWCGVRQNQTWVQVPGFARPICDHAALQTEWLNDFAEGGQDLSAFDGDADRQASIRETRRELNAAFGRTLTVAEIRALTVNDIPRCTRTVRRSTPLAQQLPAGTGTSTQSQQ